MSSFRVVVASLETSNYPKAQDLLRHLSPSKIHRELVHSVVVLDKINRHVFKGSALPEYIVVNQPNDLLSALGIEREIMEIQIVLDTNVVLDKITRTMTSIKSAIE